MLSEAELIEMEARALTLLRAVAPRLRQDPKLSELNRLMKTIGRMRELLPALLRDHELLIEEIRRRQAKTMKVGA